MMYNVYWRERRLTAPLGAVYWTGTHWCAVGTSRTAAYMSSHDLATSLLVSHRVKHFHKCFALKQSLNKFFYHD